MLDIESIKKHLGYLASSDWDNYKAAFADNVIYEELATRMRVQGAADYVKVVQRWKKAFPDLKATVKSSVISGDKAILELEWEGTHGGPLDSPFGTLAATNKKGRVSAVLVMTLANDKIVESHHYFDLMSLLGQIGPIPGISVPPQAKPAAAPKPA